MGAARKFARRESQKNAMRFFRVQRIAFAMHFSEGSALHFNV
jgi:hypothetical protein